MRTDRMIGNIVLFLLVISAVSAGSYNPESYWGYVYIEGVLAPSGTVLTVESTSTGELFANQTLPYDAGYPGSYSIVVNFDDGYTAEDEGAGLNEVLTWKVDGTATSTPAVGADIAETGKTNNNFAVYAILDPVMAAALQTSADSVSLGESLLLTVLLNNTGSGSGNATLAGIDDASITTDLAKTIYVGRNSTNQTTVNLTASACGEYNPTLTINYYNLNNVLVNNITEQFSFNVTGADLTVSDVSASSSSPTEGDNVIITANLTNNGDSSLSGYAASFYYGSNLIDTASSNNTLAAGESAALSVSWTSAAGSYTLSANASTSSAECSTANNRATASITVQEEVITPSSGGSSGGGGGGSSTGASSNTQCNDSIDNDEDGLIDLSDPGCESLNDDNESDYAQEEDTGGLAEEDMNETAEEPQAEEEKKGSGGFVPAVTGFVVKVAEGKTNWLLIFIIIILCSILTYKLLSGIERQQPQQRQKPKENTFHTEMGSYMQKREKDVAVKVNRPEPEAEKNKVEVKHDPFHDEMRDYVQKRSKKGIFGLKSKEDKDISSENKIQEPEPKKAAGKPVKIQKSIKISSKKEIIDKLKEVYEENG